MIVTVTVLLAALTLAAGLWAARLWWAASQTMDYGEPLASISDAPELHILTAQVELNVLKAGAAINRQAAKWTAWAAGFAALTSVWGALAPTYAASPSPTYTLYRGSLLVPGLRVHVATFDAADPLDADYNKGNCQHVAEMFMKQPGDKVRFWCESGRFKK